MSKANLGKVFRTMQKSISKHSPEILTGLGIGGMIYGTVEAIRSTPKALRSIEAKKEELGVEKLTPADTIKATWKHYVPTVVIETASMCCLIGASRVSLKRNAALATAYKLSENALHEYRDAVVETVGDKKEQTIREKIAEKKVIENPVVETEVIQTGYGNTLCFDPMSGRHFYSDIDRIKKAENKLNKRMLHDISGCASLNDFYDELNLEQTDTGDMLGWNTDRLIDIQISSHVTKDGKPSIVLDYYNSKPDYGFDRF